MTTPTTDRDLLELAAKAAGIRYDKEASKPHPKSGAFWGLWLVFDGEPPEHARRHWNPLTNDGDALRLAVNLSITLDFRGRSETVQANVSANWPKKHRWWATGETSWVTQEYVPEEMWATGRTEDCRFADWYLQTYPDVVKGIGPATRRAIVRAAAEIGKAMP